MDAAVLLDLLGNENRRRILRLLSHKPCYVTEISEYLGVSPKAVIDHLRRLEEAGLVESRTDDQRRKYFHIARNLRLEVSVSPYRFGAKSAYPASRSLDMRGRCQHISLDVPASTDDRRDRVDESDGSGGTSDHEIETEEDLETVDLEADALGEDPRRDKAAAELGDREIDGPQASGGDSPAANGGTETGEVADLARQYAYLEDVESELSLAQRWVHGRVTDVLDDLSERLGSEADSRFYAELLSALLRGPKTARDVATDLNASLDRVETALNRLSDRGLVEYDGTGWRIR